jgi:predicted cytidylate kinase
MRGVVVTVGGPPGSGKSTAARGVGGFLGRTYYSAGAIFRAEAKRRNMTLPEFGSLAEKNPEIDMWLDEKMVLLASPSSLLEGRIIGELLLQRRIPVYRIMITATEEERASRISGRDAITYDEALQAMRQREASEKARYIRYYGIDLDKLEYDMQVDATELGPIPLREKILADLPPELKD